MRGQAADYDHWRQLGLTGWGWDDVLPFFKQHEDHFLGASERTRSAANGASRRRACAGTSSTRSATPPSRPASSAIPDFNTGDNEGSCAFHVNQKRGRRWSAARGFLKPVLEPAEPAARNRLPGRRHRVRRQARRRRALAAERRGEIGALPRRGDPGGRLDRLGRRCCMLSGVGPAAQLARARHSGRARPARRRREPAGSSAAAADLQGRGRQDAQRDLSLAASAARAWGSTTRCSAAAR